MRKEIKGVHNNPFLRKPDNPNYLRRARHHDYNRPARYMITLHKAPKVGTLSTLTGDLRIKDSSLPDYPRAICTQTGECFLRALMRWKDEYPQIEVADFVVMPDHVHLCLVVKQYLPSGLSRAIARIMGFTTNELLSSLRSDHNQDRKNDEISSSLRSDHNQDCREKEVASSLRSDHNQDCREEKIPFFSKGFNDSIAYSHEQWKRQLNYVADNPRRLLLKRKFRNFYFQKWLISIGDLQYAAKGNIHLLKNPDIQVVRFSSKYPDGYFEKKIIEWDRCVENNGVLISPYIHPNENDVRKKALSKGGSVIRICENGFSDRFAPYSTEFDYNSQGKLLLIAPVKYSSQKENISYEKAQSLNKIAELIASTDWYSGEAKIRAL